MLSSSQWPASHYGFSHLFRHTLPVLPQPFPCRKSRDAGLAAALCQLTAVSESGAGKLRPSGVHPLNPGSVHKRSRSLIQPRHSAASARHPLVSQELVKTSVRNRETLVWASTGEKKYILRLSPVPRQGAQTEEAGLFTNLRLFCIPSRGSDTREKGEAPGPVRSMTPADPSRRRQLIFRRIRVPAPDSRWPAGGPGQRRRAAGLFSQECRSRRAP